MRHCPKRLTAAGIGLTILSTFSLPVASDALAQDRFEQLPGYQEYINRARSQARLVTGGRIADVIWSEDGRFVQFREGGGVWWVDLESGERRPAPADQRLERPVRDASGPATPRAPRGRQVTRQPSPDGQWVAEHRDFNLVLVREDDSDTIQVTSDGRRDFKYATGSWVYGEELRQTTAMWWSPDSSMIAFYEFDERNVKDYYLVTGLIDWQTELYPEAYPKAGAENPIVGLHVHDLESGTTIRVKIGDDPNQYIYNIRFSPDGSELLFNRTNRQQNVLDIMAADPRTGETRIILTETQETFQKNSPMLRFLSDNERFIWETEKTGWQHYELRHINGDLLHTLTDDGDYPTSGVVQIDEENGWLYYSAFSSDHPLNMQLHRVRLDGTQRARLSTRELNHTSFDISPNHTHFIATFEAIDTPPATALYDMNGNEIAVLAESDMSAFLSSGIPMPELFTFKADDGVTDLFGVLYKPSDFDPDKTYPLIIDVYGGPLTQGVRNRFSPGDAYTEFGVLIAKIDNRGTVNRGKAFETATYRLLGTVDMKDQADGVRHLAQRPYVDGNRVGIHGFSYGGYLAALAVLKHPDVFHVAVAGAPVTDWRNYDTIYTERYMYLPQDNKEGYDLGSCLTYADQLEGQLLLIHGMVDDNVHPANIFQLAHRLQQARKPFQMMLYPTSGHGIRSPSFNPLRWEFLLDNLVFNHQD